MPSPVHTFAVTDPSNIPLLLLNLDMSTRNERECPTCGQSLLAAKAAEPVASVAMDDSQQPDRTGTLPAVRRRSPQRGDKTVVQSDVHKPFRTDPEAALKSKGIQTVIMTGAKSAAPCCTSREKLRCAAPRS